VEACLLLNLQPRGLGALGTALDERLHVPCPRGICLLVKRVWDVSGTSEELLVRSRVLETA
jgi:hypothetical protein